MKEKIFSSFLAALFLAGVSSVFFRSDLRAEENEPLAGVAVLEGEVYYWPVLAGEYPAPENRLVALERDLRAISLLAGLDFQSQAKEILPESVPVLDELTGILNANPDLIIRITVRPEKPGKTKTDPALAGERAGQVRDYLLAQGIDPSRVSAQGIGASAGDKNRPDEPAVEISITDQDQNLSPQWMKLKKNTDFYASDEVKTGKGKVKIIFSNGAVLVLRPGTHIKISDGNSVRLFRGGLFGSLENLPGGQGFAIATANARASVKSGSLAAGFQNGISAFSAIKGEISCLRRAEPEKILPLSQGKKIIIQNGREPERPKPIDPGEIRNLQEEFSLKNFNSSQSLFDEEIRKRLEIIKPAAPPKSPEPPSSPPSQETFPSAGTQSTTP